MALFEELESLLGSEIEDPEEETFLLFAKTIPSHNLGFVDPKAESVEVTIGRDDYTIYQSPVILTSQRAEGTTGAVLWKLAPLVASWLSSPSNILFKSRLLHPESTIIELGCGISPLNALSTRGLVRSWLLTDQGYVSKLVEKNIAENTPPLLSPSSSSSNNKRATHKTLDSAAAATNKKRNKSAGGSGPSGNKTKVANREIMFRILDWQTDQVTTQLLDFSKDNKKSFDAVVASDCIYNEAILDSFVHTCADVCSLREADLREQNDNDDNMGAHPEAGKRQCICVIAQQLRSSDVFLAWLDAFWERFRVWRVPDDMLQGGLRSDDGFVIHIGIIRSNE